MVVSIRFPLSLRLLSGMFEPAAASDAAGVKASGKGSKRGGR